MKCTPKNQLSKQKKTMTQAMYLTGVSITCITTFQRFKGLFQNMINTMR